MLNIKQALIEDIQAGISAAQVANALPAELTVPKIIVNHTEKSEYGDYASPIALALTKVAKKPPLEIVEIIAQYMPKKEYIGKLEAAAPGFLNIRLNPGWMSARLDDVIAGNLADGLTFGQGKSINLEFISANPTGPLTLANCRTAFGADTLANVLIACGYNVTREYYINDAGAQVKKLGESVLRRILEAQGETVEFAEELYQGDYIKEIAKRVAEDWKENEGKVFTKVDLENAEIQEKVSHQAVQILLDAIKQTIKEDLHIEFDVWTSERALRESGVIEKALTVLRERGQTYKKEDAEWLKTTQYGDDQDRVLVKKDGEYAYISPDIAYHHNKYERQFDLIFTFVGADHQGHIPKLRAAMQALGNDVSKLHLVVAQWFRLIRSGVPVKVSKRAGNIITPHDVIAEVGYDATRFFLLQHRLDTHMDFDLDLAKEQSDRNPVYYVQYAFVRLQSILRRAKEAGVLSEVGETIQLSNDQKLTHTVELELMRVLYRWPEIMQECAEHFTVHQLNYYALELSKVIHAFYHEVPVLNAEPEMLIKARLQLILAARTVLGKTLEVMGLNQPDVM